MPATTGVGMGQDALAKVLAVWREREGGEEEREELLDRNTKGATYAGGMVLRCGSTMLALPLC